MGNTFRFDNVLGLNLDKNVEEEIPKEVSKLVEQRNKAREEKNWAESDRLREVIKSQGYLVEDSQNSCKIHKIR
jgi:cysteinyl-tRNA synthetase